MEQSEQSTSTDGLRRRAERAGAQLELGDGHAWVIVVGTVDGRRASAAADLVDELVRQPSFHRVSVDLTSTVLSDRGAAAIFNALRAGAAPGVDVTTPGPLGWLVRGPHAA
jgi:hypothetical protein